MPAAESLLLELARDLSAHARAETPIRSLDSVIATLTAAYAPDAPLARVMREDWVRADGDKTARLALSWAREQVRLVLADVLQRAGGGRTLRAREDPDTLAWLWLAACEALAHEPPSAVSDRVHALAAFLTTP